MSIYSSFDVAKKFLELSKRDGIQDMTHMKLQKLVYFAQLVSILGYDNPVLSDEFQAWDYGPVCPRLYNRLRGLGMVAITSENTSDILVNTKELTDSALEVVDSVWEKLKHHSPAQLSSITHAVDSPWYVVYYKTRYGVISPETMKKYRFGKTNS